MKRQACRANGVWRSRVRHRCGAVGQTTSLLALAECARAEWTFVLVFGAKGAYGEWAIAPYGESAYELDSGEGSVAETSVEHDADSAVPRRRRTGRAGIFAAVLVVVVFAASIAAVMSSRAGLQNNRRRGPAVATPDPRVLSMALSLMNSAPGLTFSATLIKGMW